MMGNGIKINLKDKGLYTMKSQNNLILHLISLKWIKLKMHGLYIKDRLSTLFIYFISIRDDNKHGNGVLALSNGEKYVG